MLHRLKAEIEIVYLNQDREIIVPYQLLYMLK